MTWDRRNRLEVHAPANLRHAAEERRVGTASHSNDGCHRSQSALTLRKHGAYFVTHGVYAQKPS